jgi:hypothetical protein
MDEHAFDEIAAFEIPSHDAAMRLSETLAGNWVSWIDCRREAAVVVIRLNDGPIDLGVLLRVVENWVEHESLCAIRYHLDGRDYVLHAGSAELLPLAV